MAKDGRALREEAAAATAAGKFKRALAAYLDLEKLEPGDAQWPKRAAETYRRLGNNRDAVTAYARSAERYAQNGFLVQAIAVCKLILQLDPKHADALRRVSQMNEEIGRGPTRAAGFAENNPELHSSPNVDAIRRRSNTGIPTPPLASPAVETTPSKGPPPVPPAPHPVGKVAPPVLPRTQTPQRNKPSTPPVMSRTRSKPVTLQAGAALETVTLSQQVVDAFPRDATNPSVHVIPLDDEPHTGPLIEVEAGTGVIYPDVDDSADLDLADIDDNSTASPPVLGAAQARALAATPLFAGLPHEALEALVKHLTLVPLEPGQTLFKEGDIGDALYVIAEGEVAVQAEGPPRVEMARMGPGAFLGEVALMTDQPRSATVSAVTNSELLRIDRITLSRVLANHGDVLVAVLRFVRDRLVDRFMRTSPIFRPFDDAERAELSGRFKFLEIEANTVLLASGKRPDGLYIVLAGKFAVKRAGTTVATLGPGELIGEAALLSGSVSRSDVVADGKGLAVCLPAEAFREVIMTHPHVLEYLGEKAEHSRRLEIL